MKMSHICKVQNQIYTLTMLIKNMCMPRARRGDSNIYLQRTEFTNQIKLYIMNCQCQFLSISLYLIYKYYLFILNILISNSNPISNDGFHTQQSSYKSAPRSTINQAYTLQENSDKTNVASYFYFSQRQRNKCVSEATN